jgi:hypothetical protein
MCLMSGRNEYPVDREEGVKEGGGKGGTESRKGRKRRRRRKEGGRVERGQEDFRTECMRNTGGRGQKERGWVRYDTADTSSSV